ncbi:MAG: efflux system, outer rane lipoprotein, NodT family [Proteobacteria bacterium]|nr:efflux system, outer rane lipoprotein, NodT family [Pseudomonadota bacterium]
MKNFPRSFLLAFFVLLPACTSLPMAGKDPELQIPERWATPSTDAIASPDTWWKNFGDPRLDELIDQALRRNNDFATATIRVRRAQLQAAQVDTNLTPNVAVGANSARSRRFDPTANFDSSGVGASLSFELDFWGKLASQRAAAHLEAKASEADCRAFAISLLGTTTQLYWQLAYLNKLLALSAADIAYAEQTLALTRSRYTAGAISGLNMAQAELNLSTQEAARTQLVQQQIETRHALALLLNHPPETEIVEPSALESAMLPEVAAGLPADILASRPDLHSAEYRLRATLANIDYTRAYYYPSFSLTGSVGTSSAALLEFLKNPVATLGVGLTLPFIQWNTTRLAIRVSETQHEEAVINYRQRLYNALAEVEGSLSARTQLRAAAEKLNQSMEQARRAEAIAQTRFKSGSTDVQLWLDAQARLRTVERSLVFNRLSQLNNQATLYRALGLGAGSERVGCR